MDLQCCASFRYTAKWPRHVYVHIEYSSLWYTVGPHCSSIWNVIVWSATPKLPVHPTPPPMYLFLMEYTWLTASALRLLFATFAADWSHLWWCLQIMTLGYLPWSFWSGGLCDVFQWDPTCLWWVPGGLLHHPLLCYHPSNKHSLNVHCTGLRTPDPLSILCFCPYFFSLNIFISSHWTLLLKTKQKTRKEFPLWLIGHEPLSMQVWSLASLRGSSPVGVALSRGVGCRHGSDLVWLWCGRAAAAPIRPITWELPYAVCAALKSKKQKQTNKQKPIWNKPSLKKAIEDFEN